MKRYTVGLVLALCLVFVATASAGACSNQNICLETAGGDFCITSSAGSVSTPAAKVTEAYEQLIAEHQDASGIVFIAFYQANGRMVSCEQRAENDASEIVIPEEWESCKIFFLSSGYILIDMEQIDFSADSGDDDSSVEEPEEPETPVEPENPEEPEEPEVPDDEDEGDPRDENAGEEDEF